MNLIDLELLIYDLYPEFEQEDHPIDALLEKFKDDPDAFQGFIGTLINSIDIGESALTGKRFKGFAKDGIFLAKVEI